MSFADNLKTLPSVSHLAALHLIDAEGQQVATLENRPGQAGPDPRVRQRPVFTFQHNYGSPHE